VYIPLTRASVSISIHQELQFFQDGL